MADPSKDRFQGSADEMGGKVTSAVGDLTGDERTQAEGERDQTKGQVKQGVAYLTDKADDLVKKVTGD